MEDEYWEYCPYSGSQECPQPDSIARVYLLPQLLDSLQIEATKELCRTCGKYLDEKRKYPRVERPLKIMLHKGGIKACEGDILNISEGGALIRLQEWGDFDKDEKVTLEILPPHSASGKGSNSKLMVLGRIKRIENHKQQLAIVFLQVPE